GDQGGRIDADGRGPDGDRGRRRGLVDRRRRACEAAAGAVDEDADLSRVRGDDDVGSAVAVHVGDLERIVVGGTGGDGVGRLGGEGAVAVAEQDADAAAASVPDRQVEIAVAVEIDEDQGPGPFGTADGGRRLEGAVAVAEEDVKLRAVVAGDE